MSAPVASSLSLSSRRPIGMATARRVGAPAQQVTGQMSQPAHGGRTMDAPAPTLGSYIPGAENAVSYSSICHVVRHPGDSHNPLYIHGPHGVGKTHLLHAMAQALVRGGLPAERVIYLTAETFTRRLNLTSRSGRTNLFRDRYRQAAALLIDDIGFLAHHNAAMQELCQTIDALRENGGQVVISDVLPPAQLPVTDRLRSRLAGGLTIAFRPPSSETLVSLARYRCRLGRLPVHDDTITSIGRGVYERAGNTIGGAVPALESVLRVLTEAPTLSATDALSRALALPRTLSEEQTGVAVERVLQAVCQYFGITQQALLSKKRDPWTVQARQLAMYLLHEDGGLGVTRVGRVLGRDHSTVLHGHAQVARALASGDKEVNEGLVDIRRAVLAGTLVS